MISETPLQRTERLVREGERRLINQKALIARLEYEGDAPPLRAALLRLSQMEDYQRLSIEHLDRERESFRVLTQVTTLFRDIPLAAI